MANPISMKEARQKAAQFLSQQTTNSNGRRNAPVNNQDLTLAHQASFENGQAAYYVFNDEAGGFVIVSGNDCTEAILGYSGAGSFDVDAIPSNMKYWLDEYANQIKYAQEHHSSSSSGIRKKASHAAIAPMITTKWDQDYPYNEECPDFFGQGKCITGCGATAMAQLMYYHRAKSVTETIGNIPAYETLTYHVPVEAIPAGSPIDWDNMLDNYDGSKTNTQIKAVANLMKYCGAAVKMDYSKEWSSSNESDIEIALKAYFNYNYKTGWVYLRNYSSDEEWDNLIYSELSCSRPVMYSGRSENSGHFFICDGYDGAGYYHINWGWGGYCDGYFLLSTLDPYKPYQNHPGISSGYNRDQAALINAEPRNRIPSGTGISFADAQVRLLCLQNWDTNDDGDLSEKEAAAVTDLGNVFSWNSTITSFDELKFFTGLTYISSYAFGSCSFLTSVTIPNSVTSIGWGAFSGCGSLTSITIPNSVTYIEYNAFEHCFFVKDAFINNSALTSSNNWGATLCDEEPEDGIFINGTTVVGCRPWVTSATIPDGVTSIGDGAFYSCRGLSSITIPNSVTSIGNEAFMSCYGLTSVTIPNGVTSIGDMAFWNCYSLKSVTISNSVTSIGSSAFAYCYDLTSVTIGNGVTNIGSDAFLETPWYNSQPDGLVYIGKVAYKYKGTMPNNTQITIKDGTLGIAGSAFENCTTLTSITLPNSLTTIGYWAFENCSGLKEIYCYAEETPEVPYSAFYDVDVCKIMLVVPDNSYEAYKAHEVWGQFQIETPTGINLIPTLSKDEEIWYDLSGRRINKPINGIYIKNGKKVLVR